MRNFMGTAGKAPGNIARVIVIAAFIAAAVLVVSSLTARVARLESDLQTAQAEIDELAASQSVARVRAPAAAGAATGAA
jgi:hypothetical protein